MLGLVAGLCRVDAIPTFAQASNIGAELRAIKQLAEEALEASRAAETAATVAAVKTHADAVFETVWGLPSGLTEGHKGAEAVHGWTTRWQVTNADFDAAFAQRYGSTPPAVTDPAHLGIAGRGRHVRAQLQAVLDAENAPEAQKNHAGHVIASLNNVIGWMKMDDGVTKAERQPRVDLTREWDAPSSFWLSTADTGWLYEVYAQALNMLKTDYAEDVALARQHATAMTKLIEKCLNGVDADSDGTVKPAMMEGGLHTVLQHAQLGGFLAP